MFTAGFEPPSGTGYIAPAGAAAAALSATAPRTHEILLLRLDVITASPFPLPG
jgi:hypothetical protein